MGTLNIKHILVPTDFSESSINALDTAVAMAKRQGAKLTLLHILNQNLIYHGHFDMISTMIPTLDALREESNEILGQLKDKLADEKGLKIAIKTIGGAVSSEICKVASEDEADLIVMGSHGTSGFRAFFMGSNAYSVVKHAPCPVLTIPTTGKWESFTRILFPIRDTPNALQKYDFISPIIRQNKSVLHILGIPDPKSNSSNNWVGKNVQQLKTRLKGDAVAYVAQQLEPTDKIAETVLNIAAIENIDLITITATLDFGFRDFFIGPYTQQIINHAKVPVLSIRPAASPNSEKSLAQTTQSGYSPILPEFGLPVRATIL